jgi:pimeloyl-ACP methyl ester carboxylesterase
MLPVIRSTGTDTTTTPVVLIHGFLSSADADFMQTGWLDRLSTANRRAIAIDLPAHGSADVARTPADASTASVVTAIAQTIGDAFPGEDVDVVGYSLGARLAWELPAQGAPVRRLVLGGLSLGDPFAGLTAAGLRGALDGENGDGMTGMIAGLITASGGDAAALATLVEGLGSQPFDAARHMPAQPVLLARGRDDVMTHGLAELVSALPDARLLEVPGDHVGALASPQLQDEALRFLA